MAELVETTVSPPQQAADRFFSDALRAELTKLKVQREARRLLDVETLAAAYGDDTDKAEVMVYDPLPTASPELIPGILPESGTTAIVGETNTGKSLIALEIGSSLLTGEPLWGQIEPNRMIKKLVYILGEHTVQTIQGLYHRTQLPHAGKFQLIGPEHLHPYKALVVGGVAQQVAIDRLVKWTDGAELIVFDPLAGFIQGLGAEQDNASMRTLIDSMSYVAQKNGAACLILSHMGKPRLDDDGSEIRRFSYAMRGASAQEDALTHVFYLRRELQVKQQGPEEKFKLEVRKFKGNPSSDFFKLRRDPMTKRNSLEGEKKSRISTPNIEDKMELLAAIQRFKEDKPKFENQVIMECVAIANGMNVEQLKRIVGEIQF